MIRSAATIALLTALATGLSAQGSLRIRVRWDGEVPARKKLVIPLSVQRRSPADAAFCGKCIENGSLHDERLVVDPVSKGIRDIAITLSGPESPPQKLPPQALLDNKDCRFSPRVQFAPLGKALKVKNSDAVTHNARILGRGRRQFWNGIIPASKTVETPEIRLGGVLHVVCDVHPWMEAWIIGTRNHWVGVTGTAGELLLKDIPAGSKGRVHLWHPQLGRARIDVVVEDGKEVLKTLTQKNFRKP